METSSWDHDKRRTTYNKLSTIEQTFVPSCPIQNTERNCPRRVAPDRYFLSVSKQREFAYRFSDISSKIHFVQNGAARDTE